VTNENPVKLDQRRYPFTFGTMMGVAATATAAIGGAVGGRLLHIPFLTATVAPNWFVLTSSVALVATLGILVVNSRRRRKQVFLLVSAFVQKHWVTSFVRSLGLVLDRHGYKMNLLIPANDYSGTEQVRHLAQILERSGDYDGGFVIAAEPDQIEDELRSFCDQFAKPVVFVDVQPFPDSASYPPSTAFVGYRPTEIGRVAANFVARRLGDVPGRPSVLVVGSTTLSGRQDSFAKTLSGLVPHSDIQVSSSGAFVRRHARKIVAAHLADFTAEGRSLDAIFCTNDEMALGAVDAITAVGGAGSATTFVVGVDGTEEAVELIRAGGTPLTATVRQDAQKEAETAVACLRRMLAGKDVRSETFLAPELLPVEAAEEKPQLAGAPA
jgi:ribose transport system substrate-binding protein